MVLSRNHSLKISCVLVLYCCVTNYHNFTSLTQNTYFFPKYVLSHSLCRLGVQIYFNWVLCSGFHKTEIKILSGMQCYLEMWLRRNLSPNLFRLLANSLLCGWRPESLFSCWSSAGDHAQPITLRSFPYGHLCSLLPIWYFLFKTSRRISFWISLVLNSSLEGRPGSSFKWLSD